MEQVLPRLVRPGSLGQAQHGMGRAEPHQLQLESRINPGALGWQGAHANEPPRMSAAPAASSPFSLLCQRATIPNWMSSEDFLHLCLGAKRTKFG